MPGFSPLYSTTSTMVISPLGVGGVLTVYRSSGANLRSFREGHGLAFVLDILMAGNLRVTLEKCLKNDHGCCFEPSSVESEQHIHRAVGFTGDKGGLRGPPAGRSPTKVRWSLCPLERRSAYTPGPPSRPLYSTVSVMVICSTGWGGFLPVHGSGSPNLRLPERNRLPLVFQICVRGY